MKSLAQKNLLLERINVSYRTNIMSGTIFGHSEEKNSGFGFDWFKRSGTNPSESDWALIGLSPLVLTNQTLVTSQLLTFMNQSDPEQGNVSPD